MVDNFSQDSKQNSFGAYIRNERERRKLSLREVEIGTRVKMAYLEAIENDQFEAYPEEPYVKGFIRSYAQFLGLDEDMVITHFQYFFQKHLEVQTQDKRRSVSVMGVRIPVFTLVLILIFGSVIVYAGAKFKDIFPSYMFSPPEHATPAAATVSPSPASDQAAPVVNKYPVEVRIVSHGTTWIQVMIDDYTEYSEMINTGEERVWAALKKMKIRSGNWDIIEVYNNNEKLSNPESGVTLEVIAPKK